MKQFKVIVSDDNVVEEVLVMNAMNVEICVEKIAEIKKVDDTEIEELGMGVYKIIEENFNAYIIECMVY